MADDLARDRITGRLVSAMVKILLDHLSVVR